MNTIFQSLSSFFSMSPLSAQERDDAYLSQSVDIYDLERRMRNLDTSQHNLNAIAPYGLLMGGSGRA